MSSSAWDVHVALASAIDANAGARVAAGRTGVAPIAFSQRAPARTPLGYYTLGDTGESEQNVMARRGSIVDVTIHAWGTDTGMALRMWAALETLLNRQPLPLAAGLVLLGQSRLVTTLADPAVAGTETATRAIVRYAAVCRAAAVGG